VVGCRSGDARCAGRSGALRAEPLRVSGKAACRYRKERVVSECHGLDTQERVCFYEQDFYVLSNFSSFEVEWASEGTFKTSEHLYHWLRFATKPGGWTSSEQGVLGADAIARLVRQARSAHDAFKLAQANKRFQRHDWNDVKVEFMRKIVRAKAAQHEYVRRKLLATGDRELVENSWRDDFWGWGPNRDGQNMLGKLWMEVRAELASAGEAGTAATVKQGAVHEHAVPKGDAQ
jgi:ribA/ribD-fused uncharacterized protein